MKLTHLFSLLASVALVACGGGTNDAGSAGTSDSIQLAPGAEPAAGAPADSAATSVEPTVTHVATITTDAGDIVLDLFGADAPKTVENFIGLAASGYYDGVAFHRVVADFVVQAGDPVSKDTTRRAEWGTGGKPHKGSKLPDEIDSTNRAMRLGYVNGIVAMANTGQPNSGGSQFFIVLNDAVDKELKDIYTIFGRVRSGSETVGRIELSSEVGQEIARNPVRITSVKVVEAGSRPRDL